jgi:hypothetical protein
MPWLTRYFLRHYSRVTSLKGSSRFDCIVVKLCHSVNHPIPGSIIQIEILRGLVINGTSMFQTLICYSIL